MSLEAYLTFRRDFAAIDPARYPIDWIDHQIAAGVYRCWGNEHAAIIAEIHTYPSGLKEVHGVAAAGDLQEIVSLIPNAEQWGREQGCVGAEILSHIGWAKVMASHGYKMSQARVYKEL